MWDLGVQVVAICLYGRHCKPWHCSQVQWLDLIFQDSGWMLVISWKEFWAWNVFIWQYGIEKSVGSSVRYLLLPIGLFGKYLDFLSLSLCYQCNSGFWSGLNDRHSWLPDGKDASINKTDGLCNFSLSDRIKHKQVGKFKLLYVSGECSKGKCGIERMLDGGSFLVSDLCNSAQKTPRTIAGYPWPEPNCPILRASVLALLGVGDLQGSTW